MQYFLHHQQKAKLVENIVKQEAHFNVMLYTQVDKELTSGEYFLKQQKRQKVRRGFDVTMVILRIILFPGEKSK